jgi:hypothetical protein
MAPRLHVFAGWMKPPFSLTALLPVAQYELADPGPNDQMLKDCGFGGRDVGMMTRLSPLRKKRWLRLMAGVFQGGQIDAHARLVGLAAARVESSPWKHLQLGADVAWRPSRTGDDLPKGLDPLDTGMAWSADALLQFKRWQLRAEVMAGDRTDRESRLDPSSGVVARRFLGAWGLLAWRLPLGSHVLMPVARVEWLDSDRDRAVGQHWWLSAALNWELNGRVRLLADWSRQRVEPGSLPVGEKPTPGLFARDFDRVVVQLQVGL